MTPDQIKLIRIAAKKVGLNDAQYRMLLWNVAKVKSCLQLTNGGFEDVMAIFEQDGFVFDSSKPFYFRDKVFRRGELVNERVLRKIETLAVINGQPYPLESMTLRMSRQRTRKTEELTPREAFNLIEAIKKIIERENPAEAVWLPALPVRIDASQPAAEQSQASADGGEMNSQASSADGEFPGLFPSAFDPTRHRLKNPDRVEHHAKTPLVSDESLARMAADEEIPF